MQQVRLSASGVQPEDFAPLDPLREPAWDAWVGSRPDSSFFHRSAWARVLQTTYGHRPVYFCRRDGQRLTSLLPVMEVRSPLTGIRGVSLPFTDYCLSLKGDEGELEALYRAAVKYGSRCGWRYFECRSKDGEWPGATPSLFFWAHLVDLEKPVDDLFKALEGAVRRGIRKAAGSELRVEFSSKPEALRTFYRLHCGTRRRHGVPPQPVRFFENIGRYVLEPGHGQVGLAALGEQTVAAAVFFHHGREAIYKFGASDYAFQRLRPNNLLMWEAIKRYAVQGFSYLHLGRTSLANDGLRRFKLGFGAREEKLSYFRYHFGNQGFVTDVDRSESWRNWVFRCLPEPVLRLAGEVLYPHLS